MRYWTRDREAGNKIESFSTLQDAQNAIKAYEEQDRKDGIFTEDFYEICEEEEQI